MKLVFCTSCLDIVNPTRMDWRKCFCGQTATKLDPDRWYGGIIAAGPCEVLTLSNDGIAGALKKRPLLKDERIEGSMLKADDPGIHRISRDEVIGL